MNFIRTLFSVVAATAVLVRIVAPAPAIAEPPDAPASTKKSEGACTYGGKRFPNGATTTFDCPLNPQACYSNAVMLVRWTCKNGKWCNQSGACYATLGG